MFLRCRMCWRVAVIIFLTICAIEAIVLIPSYRGYQAQWLQRLDDAGLSAVRTAFWMSVERTDLRVIEAAGARWTTGSTIRGGALYDANGNLLGRFGEPPETPFENGTRTGTVVGDDEPAPKKLAPRREPRSLIALYDKPRLEVLWSPEDTGLPYYLMARLDCSGLRSDLVAFVFRVLGTVLLITLVVTVVTMFILGRWVLEPLLDLRHQLLAVGDNPLHADHFSVHFGRDDELGDVINAFNGLIQRVSASFRATRTSEKRLRRAQETLETQVEERTRELTLEIAERRQIEAQLRENREQLLRRATYDDLTDLPNRLFGMDRLDQALARAKREGGLVATMFLDLDNFKNINDTLGHARGDALLVASARRLSDCLRRSDTVVRVRDDDGGSLVARIGGDEFMIILPRIEKPADAEAVAARILAAYEPPFDLDGHEVFASVSLGITLSPHDGIDPQALMANADAAMYRAKEAGRNTYRFFAPEMNRQAIERLNIESHLRHAMERDELFIHYQPLVDVGSGQTIGAEALIRWHNPELGLVPPDRFIPVAESTGLIIPIGDWILRTACRNAAGWVARTDRPFRLSVNASSRQFRDRHHMLETIRGALADSGLPPHCLELEITESLLIDDKSEAAIFLKTLREMGVRISIDDFGTGYSSLSYLKRFPVNTLKIDRAFVQDVTNDPEDATLAIAIIAMAHSLDLEVVGEGVETIEQLNFLRDHGCDLAQGYYFARPMPGDLLVERLAEGRRRVRSKPSRLPAAAVRSRVNAD